MSHSPKYLGDRNIRRALDRLNDVEGSILKKCADIMNHFHKGAERNKIRAKRRLHSSKILFRISLFLIIVFLTAVILSYRRTL